jgi:hypothetical protein
MTKVEFVPNLVQRIEAPICLLPENSPTLVQYYLQPRAPETRDANAETINALNLLIPLDYMGSAEFEFGAVGNSLAAAVRLRESFVAVELQVTGSPACFFRADLESFKKKYERTVELKGWCLPQHREGLLAFLKHQCVGKNDGQYRLKERTEMNSGCFGSLRWPTSGKKKDYSEHSDMVLREERITGWFDLQNYWFVSRHPGQLAGMKHLLGISPVLK